MHIVLLHDQLSSDARPDENDVLVQVDAVSATLRKFGHQTTTLGLTLDLQSAAQHLTDLRPDLVFNLVEAVAGQGRLIYLAPALLESVHIPYTGARTEAMFLTSSKTLTKQFLVLHQLPTAPWYGFADAPSDFHRVSQSPIANRQSSISKQRWIIKSVWEEASVGLDEDSVVTIADERELQEQIRMRLGKIGGQGFAEAYIEGREFNLALLADRGSPDGCMVLPPAEIEFVGYGPAKPRVVGYRAKWDEQSFEYKNTRRRFDFESQDADLLKRLGDLSSACWRVFGLHGYARVDFRVDDQGNPWILEINANPCISPDAGFMAAAMRMGLSYDDVVQRIITDL